MKNSLIITFAILLFSSCFLTKTIAQKKEGLKDALKPDFFIGTALSVNQVAGKDPRALAVVRKHFDAIVPENCMKSMFLQPEQGHFFFDDADRFVAFGERNHLWMTGHCLVWHSQTPAWLFVDKNGKDVSRDTLIARMRNHIMTVVGRYKGRIKGWDVVNEAFNDDGTYRKSKWYEIIGEDFIPLAFKFAHEADPNAQLYYNDYGLANAAKRNAVVKLVQSLKAQGLRIDAVGEQGHNGMNYPDLRELEKSIEAFAATGVKVMITELDLTVLPTPTHTETADVSTNFEYQKSLNPYPDGLPEAIDSAWTQRYLEMFKIFLRHKDVISRVTLWGISDADTWRNDWPIKGRTDYPLLFDRQYNAKPVVAEIIKAANEMNKKNGKNKS